MISATPGPGLPSHSSSSFASSSSGLLLAFIFFYNLILLFIYLLIDLCVCRYGHVVTLADRRKKYKFNYLNY